MAQGAAGPGEHGLPPQDGVGCGGSTASPGQRIQKTEGRAIARPSGHGMAELPDAWGYSAPMTTPFFTVLTHREWLKSPAA